MDGKAIGIIMAAGLGSRMRPLTEHMPKPLVPVCGKPMIETILDAMAAAGLERIYIVTGYLGEQFVPLCTKYPQVTLVPNPDYERINNISSVYAMRDVLGQGPCYICEGDLVIQDNSLFGISHARSVYYGRMQEGWSDDWVFRMEGERIAWIGKGGENTYNMVGISYFTRDDAAVLRDAVEKTVSVPGYEELFWDEVVNDNLDVLSMGIYPVTGEQLAELDTVEELEEYEREAAGNKIIGKNLKIEKENEIH